MFASMTPFKSLTTRFKISTQSPGESALLTPGILQLSFKEYSACSWKVTATNRHWYPLELCSWFWLGGDEGKHHRCHHCSLTGVCARASLCLIGSESMQSEGNIPGFYQLFVTWPNAGLGEDHGGVSPEQLQSTTPSSLNITFFTSSNLHRDSGSWWKSPAFCLMQHVFFFFFLGECELCVDMLHWSATEDGDVIFRPALSRPRGRIVMPRCHI